LFNNESLDSAVERSSISLWQDVNILMFYCFPKPFDPDIVFSSTAAVHADPHLRVLSTGIKPCLSEKAGVLYKKSLQAFTPADLLYWIAKAVLKFFLLIIIYSTHNH
jgi:hypothetical protein